MKEDRRIEHKLERLVQLVEQVVHLLRHRQHGFPTTYPATAGITVRVAP